jgi:hypothetical protein
MNHSDKVNAILFIRPDAQFLLSGDDLIWKDEIKSEPSEQEIIDAHKAYLEKLDNDQKLLSSKRAAVELKLAALGLEIDDLKVLGLA